MTVCLLASSWGQALEILGESRKRLSDVRVSIIFYLEILWIFFLLPWGRMRWGGLRVLLQVVLSFHIPGIGLLLTIWPRCYWTYCLSCSRSVHETANFTWGDPKASLGATFLRIVFMDNYGEKKQNGLRSGERWLGSKEKWGNSWSAHT